MARLRPKIWKLCVVRTFTDIEELVGVATKLERVLGEIGETPFEPLKEEQDEGVEETLMEKQVTALNDTLVNLIKRNVPNVECLIGQKTMGSNVLSVQGWDTRRTDAGRSPKMEGRILERRIS